MTESNKYDIKSVAGKPVPAEENIDVLVIGAGHAGLTAAISAAQLGLSVILVDENPVPFKTMGDDVPLHFGQGMSGAAHNRNAMMESFIASEPMIAQAFDAGVDVRLGTVCWGIYANGSGLHSLSGTLAGLHDETRSWILSAGHIIAATGRRDMGLAFPGWEKPGVMGATATVALAQRYGALGPRRVVILGATDEALIDALALQKSGVTVCAMIEQAQSPPGDAALIAQVRDAGADIICGHVVRDVTGSGSVTGAAISAIDDAGHPVGAERIIPCDGIVLAVGTTPMIDLLDAAGCRIVFQPGRGGYAPVLDAGQRTTIPTIFTVGDAAGIWPEKSRNKNVASAEASCAIAAIAAERGIALPPAVSAPVKPPPLAMDFGEYRKAWVRASIIEARAEFHVCQCEEVTAREILEVRPPRYLEQREERRNDRSLASLLGEGPPNPDQIKRLTRAGMGPCQGRRCREQVAALLALEAAVPLSAVPLAGYRAPVRPMPLSLAGRIPEPAGQAEHWDTWFGMHAQWRPFWDVPEHYTVSGNDTAGPVASE